MNKIRIFISLIVIALALNQARAQGWERYYRSLGWSGGGRIAAVLPAPDTGFLFLVEPDSGYDLTPHGPLKIVQISETGDTMATVAALDFNTPATARDFIATSDGGYALLYQRPGTGFLVKAVLAKLDAQFQVVYERDLGTLAPGFNMIGRCLVESSAGICVTGTRADQTSYLGFLACYDLAGTLLNYATWGNPSGGGLTANRATLAAGGGIVVTGWADSPFSGVAGYGYASRFSADGSQLLWTQSIPAPQGTYYNTQDVTASPGGGYLVCGDRSYSAGFLTALDEQGNTLWHKDFPLVDSVHFSGIQRVVPVADGSGYWAAASSGMDPLQLVLLRLDLQGNVLFQRSFGSNVLSGPFVDLAALPDNGCLAAGAGLFPTMPNDIYQPFAVRLSETGQTYPSGLAGTVLTDTDNDCIADGGPTSLLMRVSAFSNGQLVNHTFASLTDGNYQISLPPGNYQLIPELPGPLWTICPDTMNVVVLPQDTVDGLDFAAFFTVQPLDSVYGYVFEDYDHDCIKDPFEPGYPNWTIAAILHGNTPGGTYTFVDSTDTNGYFNFSDLFNLTNDGSGLFSIGPPANSGMSCTQLCPQSFQVSYGDSTSYQAFFGVHCDTLPPCPIMEVDIATYQLRGCQTSVYHVHYCNTGGAPAPGAQVAVTVDPALTVLGAGLPWSTVNGNIYTFDLGTVQQGACGDFTINVFVPCGTPAGLTYCVEAHALPDSLCTPPNAQWDGSEVHVEAQCTGDSVRFILRNVGDQGMSQQSDYIIVEDNVMLMQSSGGFQLGAGQEMALAFPATGAFYRLEAEQSPGFPGQGTPTAWSEGCGTGNTPNVGFVNQYPLPDSMPWLDIFCLETVAPYDPNDKTGFPRGYGNAHYVEANTDIEYMIRFQNTGTAPAIDVELRDTIPVQFLDPLTVRPGASSHPYVWDMQGNGVVTFRFPGIQLPDSSASAEGSQGFVKFRVSQRRDLPVGTEIRNTAAIYFDQNAPVITNQTLHTIGENFIQVATTGVPAPASRSMQVRVAPNPMAATVELRVEGWNKVTGLNFRLQDQFGRMVQAVDFPGNTLRFDASGLPAGVYYYEVLAGGAMLGSGKLIR